MVVEISSAALTRAVAFERTAIALAAVFTVLPVAAVADEGAVVAPAADVLVLTTDRLEQIVVLSREWKYHPGDNPAWAGPDFDDSTWAQTRPDLSRVDEVPGGWTGIGWFRRRVMLDPEVERRAVAVWTRQAGALELYVDGRLSVAFGTVSIDPEAERAVSPHVLDSITLDPGKVHVLAVRFSNARGNVVSAGLRGFELLLGDTRPLVALGVELTRVYWGFMALGVGLFGAFALLHLLLFLSRPALTENLYFTVFNGSLVAVLCSELWMNSLSDLALFHRAFNTEMTLLFVMVLSALLLERRVFNRRLDIVFWVVVVTGLATLVWIWTRPALADVYPLVALMALGLLDMLRLAIGALLRREPGALVVAAGFAALTLSLIASILRNLGVWDVSPWPLIIGGMGGLVLAFSISLTQRIARTDRDLARRLQEVQELTTRTLEQERAARELEIARRVLEADNLRKTVELEEARKLQMAMLPRILPQIPGYEMAAHVATASEVGGDYYDFVRGANGSWTVALGDATGHGLHAGMVVGVAKSLLHAANRAADLEVTLRQIHSGLSSLQERRASMSLVLVRLNGAAAQIASAGMPPALVRKHDSGEVREVLLPGVPLGTLREAEWSACDLELSCGDSVLLMSDGLAELCNDRGEPWGYERVRSVFAEAGALDPETAIASLVRAAEDYRGDVNIADDITLLVLRASGA
jgi:serine phosphatase RsbU (regulator of sigma subunit)